MQDAVNYQRIEQAIGFLTQNFKKQPDLDEVAAQVHLSPFHFQRLFSEWAGISPKKFLQYLTTDFLKSKINETPNLNAAADTAGLSSQSRVYDHFVTLEAVTPQEFKSGGEGLEIRFGSSASPFGECFVAATERGICKMAFVDKGAPEAEIAALRKAWPEASFRRDDKVAETCVSQIFSQLQPEKPKIHLTVRGTNFQVKVWEALLNIPFGAVTTYQKIAEQIGHPNAMRAVGTAVGDNPVAYLIPCHRVIRKEGKPGPYHWGEYRKKAIIGWEMARV